MSPLDRISQLSAELSKLRDTNLILQSQLADAREQAKRDSKTIARQSEKQKKFRIKLAEITDYCQEAVHECCKKNGGSWNWGSVPIETAKDFLRRHT